MYSLRFSFVTLNDLPPVLSSTSVPLESLVTKNSSTTVLNSLSESFKLCFFKSSTIYHEYVSKPLRSWIVGVSLMTCFQNTGGKCSGSGAKVLIAKPIKHPKNLNISKWVGLFEAGFGIKVSLFSPWLFLLFTVLIKRGKFSDSISSHMFVMASLNGPPASILPSPKNLVFQVLLSVPFYLKHS